MKWTPELAFVLDYISFNELKIEFLEAHQIEFLNILSPLTIDLKARQVGWSWIAALRAYARSHLYPGQVSLFLSINQEEANNKIRYVNAFEEATRDNRLSRLTDNKTEIEYSNGSRIKSLPSRAPRGFTQADIYLDEFGFFDKDHELYTGLVPVVTRGGSLRIGSSPNGAYGVFYDIFTQQNGRYADYIRRKIPWYLSEGLCVDTDKAKQTEALYDTRERVELFGTDRLKLIYSNTSLEDFQQEYECMWLDSKLSWLPWELITSNTEYFTLDEDQYYNFCDINLYVEDAVEAIDEFSSYIIKGKISTPLYAGYDIGRKGHTSELMIISEEAGEKYPLRLNLSLKNLSFADQKATITYALRNLPVDYMFIDKSGIGMQLAEELEEEFPTVVEGIQFTNNSKTDIAITYKRALEEGIAPIPPDRELMKQIHAIKRNVTARGNFIFDVEGTKKHHGDKFWALAMAIYATDTSGDGIGYISERI